MAANPPQSSSAAPAPSPSLPLPSPNPLPLSASQEAQVRDIYYERVRQQCQDEIKAFAECALGRTFSVVGGGGAGANGNGNGNEDIQAKRRRWTEAQMKKPERVGGYPAADRRRFDSDNGVAAAAAGTSEDTTKKR
ncbi:Cytochrome c oxidase biogenesis protein Cmc1-like protein [Niveomyces insectorum RCEF 264]|uniref:COX assembly mitochondrial protein n=1 Tax=Niveomyces insectorum RCEF 264 TaxID=1081102 RepID=A0A167VJ28_9HYPO|nr:Cytochrome c oxidase biogenesis protein Cmc1-like protein [Niveomyces insectorum RCEF 264]